MIVTWNALQITAYMDNASLHAGHVLTGHIQIGWGMQIVIVLVAKLLRLLVLAIVLLA